MRACPKCLSPDDLAAVETIPGFATIASVDDDGEVTYTGHTEILWDGSRTEGVHCEACGWEEWADRWWELLVEVPDDSPTSG